MLLHHYYRESFIKKIIVSLVIYFSLTDIVICLSIKSLSQWQDLDSAEASVPRHPSIANSEELEKIIFKRHELNKTLTCHVTNGVPTPTVVWIKDNGKELDNSFYNSNYNPNTGIAQLSFPDSSSSSQVRTDSLKGLYSCVAVNFLGKAKKSFQVEII